MQNKGKLNVEPKRHQGLGLVVCTQASQRDSLSSVQILPRTPGIPQFEGMDNSGARAGISQSCE